MNKGSVKAITLLVVLALIAGAIYFLSNKSGSETIQENTEEGSANTNSNEPVLLNVDDGRNVFIYESEDLSSSLANSAEAELVLYYFYADWCPICQEEFPKLIEAMSEFADQPIVAFRVNYNDSETNEHEEALARKYGVAYQHTKVILKNGERVLKSPESWDKSRYIAEITKLLNN